MFDLNDERLESNFLYKEHFIIKIVSYERNKCHGWLIFDSSNSACSHLHNIRVMLYLYGES